MKLPLVIVLLTAGSCATVPPPTVATAPAPARSPSAPAEEVDREALARFVQSHRLQIAGCYQRELDRNPALSGTVVVLFTITPTGAPSEIGIEEDTLGNAGVARCLTALIGTWQFPFAPSEETPVAYPFVFSPSES